jgi:hypothetical protein
MILPGMAVNKYDDNELCLGMFFHIEISMNSGVYSVTSTRLPSGSRVVNS